MGKTSSAVKRRYNKKAYDQFMFFFPKGYRDYYKAQAELRGESLAGLIKRLLASELGTPDLQDNSGFLE